MYFAQQSPPTYFLFTTAVVYGVEGQQATIRCPYGGSLKMNTKYVCSSTCSAKDGRIEVGGGGMERKGRLFLRDDNTSGVLTLTISRLTIEDSGEYTCVIKRRFWYDEKTKLRLIVSRCKLAIFLYINRILWIC